MHICYINMPQQEVFKLSSLFKIGGYLVYFWSNKNFEPIHVHICKGKPSPNATKIWLTASGGCILANNSSRIQTKDLNSILEIIAAQYFLIRREWKEYSKTDRMNTCRERPPCRSSVGW